MRYFASLLLIGFLLVGGGLLLQSDRPLSQHMTLYLTRFYIQAGQPDEARTLLDTLSGDASFPPDENAPFWYERQARLYALLYDYDAALKDVNAALEITDSQQVSAARRADLYTHRGEVYLLRYEWDAALTDFNQALAIAPQHADTFFQRGVLYYTMAQRENALSDFEQYQALAPDGQYSEQAATYSKSIRAELDALNPAQD